MKKPYLITLFITVTIALNAQNIVNHNLGQLTKRLITTNKASTILPTPPSSRTCYTVENEARLRAKYPQMETVNDFEVWLQQKSLQLEAMKSSGPANYNIPTIVHVIHDGGVNNISQAQINSQFDVLNEDFRRGNSDTTSAVAVAFQSVAGDSRIEFSKALIDPLGNMLTEPGIHRVLYSTLSGLSAPPYTAQGTDIEDIIKPATSWDPTKYFNLWVIEINGGILGYAQFPSSSSLGGMPGSGGASNTDGVVIGYNYFGRTGTISAPYNLGRTATHEVGHFLGLRHIWGDANCGNDFCNDTPTQETSNGGCPSFPQITCSNGANGDQHNNFMDYTNDACMNMFTADQIARFQTVLANSPNRIELLTSNVSNPNSAPICSFTSNITTVLEGNSVSYNSTATGATSWVWNFPGGTPATSTLQNPTVIYTSGTGSPFDVTLTATNAFGNCNLTNPGYTTVIPSTGCDTLNFSPPGTLTIYSVTSGYISGWNTDYMDVSKAEYFSAASHAPYTDVTGGIYYVYAANDGGNGATVNFNVWDANGTGGSPGAIIGTTTISLASLNSTPGGIENGLIEILYPTPINVGANDFYFGITMNGFSTGDSLGIVSNTNGDTNPGTAWEEWSDNTWHAFSEAGGWNSNLSQFMSPYMTDAAPTSIPTANNTAICEGASINFDATTSANATGYNWFFPNGTPSSSTTATQTVTYASAGNYMAYLVIDGACQAQAVDSIPITVNAAQVAAFSYSAASYCANTANQTPTITGTTSGSFSVSPNTGLIINSTTGEINVSTSTAGTYTISYFTPGPNCIDNANTTITINALPNVTAISTATTLCAGNTVTLTGNGANTYLWDNSVIDGTAFNPTTTTTYNVTGTDANNCSNTDAITLNVNPLPTVVANATSTSICTGNAVTLTGSGATAYIWDNSVTDGNAFNPAATDTYTVTGTDANNCVNTNQVTIVVSTCGIPPVANFSTSSTTLCLNDCISFNDLSTSAPTSWKWYFFGATTSTSTSQSPTNICYNAASNFDVALVVSNAFGQDSLFIANYITVNTPTTPIFNQVAAICSGAGLNALPTTGNNGITGTWSPAINNTTTTQYTFTPNASQCATSTTMTITVNPNLTPTFTQVGAICSGATLNALPTTDNNGITGIWSPAINNTTTTQYTFTPNASQCATSTTMTITVNSNLTPTFTQVAAICSGVTLNSLPTTDNNGITGTWSPAINNTTTTQYTFTPSTSQCATETTMTITVNELPTVAANATETTICDGDPVTLTGSGANSYTWTNGIVDGTAFTPNTTDSYTVTGIDGNSCTDTDQITITVNTCTGIADAENIELISIFPNPATNTLNVTNIEHTLQVSLIDVTGKLIYNNTNIKKSTLIIDLSNTVKGLYFLQIRTNEKLKSYKIIKR